MARRGLISTVLKIMTKSAKSSARAEADYRREENRRLREHERRVKQLQAARARELREEERMQKALSREEEKQQRLREKEEVKANKERVENELAREKASWERRCETRRQVRIKFLNRIKVGDVLWIA